MTVLAPMTAALPLVSPESDMVGAIIAAAKSPADAELSTVLGGARGQVAALVNALFWASITTEEGRPIRGIVSLCPPDHPNASSFEEPVAVSRESLVRLLTFEGGRAGLVEVTLAAGSPAIDREIVDLAFPRDSTVVAVLRRDHVVVPRGDTTLHEGDEVLVLVTPDSEDAVRDLLIGG